MCPHPLPDATSIILVAGDWQRGKGWCGYGNILCWTARIYKIISVFLSNENVGYISHAKTQNRWLKSLTPMMWHLLPLCVHDMPRGGIHARFQRQIMMMMGMINVGLYEVETHEYEGKLYRLRNQRSKQHISDFLTLVLALIKSYSNQISETFTVEEDETLCLSLKLCQG